MSEQKLGVLGGMGPQATQVFYQFVLDRTDAVRDQDHLPTLILSDTKTVEQSRAAAALLEAKHLTGRVLWLNPMPESHWQHVGSVQTFQSICSMVSCSTLQALAAACRRLTQ